jgi:hypothetical protein
MIMNRPNPESESSRIEAVSCGEPAMQRVDPDYSGGSILNLVGGIAEHFGLDTGHPPTATYLPLTRVNTVVLLIVDALGYHQFERHLAAGDMPHLASLLRRGEATTAIATSTFPSTTATALTTIHTGLAPAEHGVLGFTTWLVDDGTVADMIHFTDLIRRKPLTNPRRLTGVPSLYRRLAEAGIDCKVVMPSAIRASTLSQWHFDGAEFVPYETTGSIPSLVAQAVAGPEKRYVVAYWPGYDAVCHIHGPSSPEAADEAAAIDLAVGRLVERVPRTGRTTLVLTADHGQRDLDPTDAIILNDDKQLRGWLASPPMGERCALYLRVRLRMEGKVVEHLSPVADVLPMADAWVTGLFGGQPVDPEFRMRTGDLLVVPRGRTQLHWVFSPSDPGTNFRGGHGGWSAAEMLVPVIAVRV